VTPTQAPGSITGIVPLLTVDDLARSIAFYEALGFAVDERWEDKGTLVGAMMRAGGMRIGLSQDDWKKGRDRTKGIGVRLSLSTTRANVDEMAARAKRAGLTLKSEPHDDTVMQSRAFEIVDPTGFLLTVFSEGEG
jgi:predicted lactoylglutathione lyase